MDNLDYDYLPMLLAEIAEEFSLKQALLLAAELGGQKIKLPLKPEKSVLAEKMDIHILRFLCERYGNTHVIIPLGPNTKEIERKRYLEKIALEYSNNQGAKIAGVHRETISRARKRAHWRKKREKDKDKDKDKNKKQLNLF